jgi:hypothetical protein
LHKNRSDLIESIYFEFRKHFEIFYNNKKQYFEEYRNATGYSDITKDAPISELINIIQTMNTEKPEFVKTYLEKIENSNLKSEFIKLMDIIYSNDITCQLNNERYIEEKNEIKNKFYETHIYGSEPSKDISLLDAGKYIISQIIN